MQYEASTASRRPVRPSTKATVTPWPVRNELLVERTDVDGLAEQLGDLAARVVDGLAQLDRPAAVRRRVQELAADLTSILLDLEDRSRPRGGSERGYRRSRIFAPSSRHHGIAHYQSRVRRKRLIAIAMATAIRPRSQSTSVCRSDSVEPFSMIARTIRR